MSGENKQNLGAVIAIAAAIVLVFSALIWGVRGCGGTITVKCPNGVVVTIKSRPNDHTFSSEQIATICRSLRE